MSHQIEFTGKVREGFNREEVKQHFASLNKNASPDMVEKLFASERSVIIKKGLDLQQAEELIQRLAQIGMECRISGLGKASFGSRDAAPVKKPQPKEFDPVHNTGPVDPSRVAAGQAAALHEEVASNSGLSLEAIPERPQEQPAAEPDHAPHGFQPAADQEPAAGHNPYQSPNANLHSFSDADEELYPPRNAGFFSGFRWIGQGFGMLFQKPLGWIGLTIVYLLINVVMGAIPLVNILGYFLYPVFIAGIFAAAEMQKTQQQFSIGELFSGFSTNFLPLVVSALILLVGYIIAFAIGFATIDFQQIAAIAANSGADPENLSSAEWVGMAGLFIKPAIIITLLMTPVMMASFFSPALILLQDLSVMESLKQSFFACLKNIHGLTLYAIVAMVLITIGALLFGIGLLVAFPVVFAASYMAYRDIFLHDTE